MAQRTLKLGTRGSRLALWQTEYVRDLLAAAAPEFDYEIEIIRTKGDKILDVALSKIGDKGLFTKELERSLLSEDVDFCVHSMKDMPTKLPEGLVIAGVPVRANPCDALVSPDPDATLEGLPEGARVATGSLRRVAQLKALRPDIETCEMRGNIDSRIKRVMDGEFDAAILAASGIERLDISGAIAQIIDADVMIPAVGQGALAIEIREGDEVAQRLCAAITDEATMRTVAAERHIMRALEGGCQVPIGAHARQTDDAFTIDAFVSSLDGVRFLRAHVSGMPEQSLDLAQHIVDDLLSQGAEDILAELR